MEEIPINKGEKSQIQGVCSVSDYETVVTVLAEDSHAHRTVVEKNSFFDSVTKNCSYEKDYVNDGEHKEPNSSQGKRKRKKQASVKRRKKISCEACGRQFRDNYNFRRHYETKHGETFPCDICAAAYNTKMKLQRHMKKHVSPTDGHIIGIKCAACSRVFRDKHNLKVHSCSRFRRRSACIFPDCDKQFYHVTKMLKHVDEDHNGKIDIVNLTFESEALFQCWKEEEELKSYAYFSMRSGTVDSYYGSYRCYVCQANGESTIGPRKTSKRWKKGHVQLGKLCPSRMFVKEINGKITVKYVTYHSHPRSVKNDKLPVPKSVKTHAKNLLMMGASPQQVRKSVCEGGHGKESIIPKGGYVISNRYFFDLKKRLDNPHLSATDENYDPVFVYKPEGQAVIVGNEALNELPHSHSLFAIGLQTKEQCVMMKKRAHVIVCVTSANTFSLCGFEILTLIVPDVFGNGYPVAYFLTSHFDENTLTLLLQCLKTRCNVNIKFVMTENNFTIFNAMNIVFENLKHYSCQSYVQNCWENESMKDMQFGDRDRIKFVEALLHENDQQSFNSLSKDFIEQYSHRTPEFVKYFTSDFLSCPEVWAMCHRNSSPDVPRPCPYTNVTLYCEYVQNQLKASLTNEKLSLSVADIALLILRIQDGHCLQYKNHLQNGTKVLSAARGKHFSGIAIKDCNVSRSCGKWSVKSQYDDSVVYVVSELDNDCRQQSCYEQCYEASCQNLCNHLYKCSCDDRFSLCEHIHKVHSLMLQQKESLHLTAIPNKKRQTKPAHTSLNMKPQNLIVVSEVFETINENEINCKTELKKERDCVTDIDVDFVSISINENGKQAEVLKRLYENQERRPICNGAAEEVENEDSVNQNNQRVCSTKILKCNKMFNSKTCTVQKQRKEANCGIGNNSNRKVNLNSSNSVNTKRLDGAGVEVPFVKVESLSDAKDTENQSDCKFKPKESEIKPRRSKRPHSDSVVQSAIENKRRHLESSPNDLKIKVEDTSENLCISGRVRSKYLKCNFCKEVFRDSYNLKRHMVSSHSDSQTYHCPLCSAVLETKVKFENHIKKHEVKNSRLGSVQCSKCLRTFRDNYNMKQHRCDVTRKQSLCIYPDCGKQFYHIKQMAKHLEEDHNDKVDCSDLYFESEKLFFAWKEEEEAKSISVFNKRNGTLGSDNVKYSYYVCQAGGESIVANVSSKKRKKKIRTGKACPSRMLVREEDGKFRVKYIAYHSHDVNDEYKIYPPLPKYVKELGKQLLLMGMSPKRVRESIEDGVLLNNNKGTQKCYAVKKRYFYDMKKGLEKKGFVFENETTADNEQWKPKEFAELINGGKQSSYDPLLIYKAQGHPASVADEELVSQPFYNKLFALGFQTRDQTDMMKEEISKVLCVKSYFNIKTDGIQLITLSVPDKFGNGYPVAHFLVNYVNEITLTFLFRSLRKQYPNLEVKTLITDNDNSIYNAMQTVFGHIRHYVCHWHVKNCWQEKIEQLVENEDHKVDIPFHLMNMLYEKDKGKFQMLCRNFGDIYSSTCAAFMEYFLDFYLQKPEVWAACHRRNLDGITYSEPFSDVNLHSEYLHNQLSSFSFSGKFSQKVAELTKFLLRVEREYSVLYKKDSPLTSPIYCSASGRHFSGLKIEDRNIQTDGVTWTVLSRVDKSVKYTVTLLEKNCNRVNCYEKCLDYLCAGLCSHLYICSCGDRADLCEHIHKVHSFKLRFIRSSDVETSTGEIVNRISLIVNETLGKESSLENSMKIEMVPLHTVEPLEDSIVCHEIYELDV